MSWAEEHPGEDLERFRSYLYLLARAHLGRRVRQKIEASDLVQQTMVDALAKRHQFRGDNDNQLAAWLRQILTHNLADALRRHGRAKRDLSRQQPLEGAIDESFCRVDNGLAASQSSPSQQVTRQEELLGLADAISQLPQAQQDAIVLHHLQGLSLSETSKRLGRTEAAVAGLLFRGLKTLHERRADRD